MYRIIEEKKTITGTSKFYIQKHKRFLFWAWWEKIALYVTHYRNEPIYEFDSYEIAKRDLDRYTEKIEVVVRYISGNECHST